MSEEIPLRRIGRRVVLRRMRLDDLAAFQAYRHDEEVGRYQGWSPFSDGDARAFLESMNRMEWFQPDEWFQIGVADPEADTLIGDIGICVHELDRHAEIGFTLSAESQGRGLACEAVTGAIDLIFDRTEVDRVIGITDSRNLAAIRLMDRLGMRQVRAVEAIFRDAPCVEFVYSISRQQKSG